MQHELTGIWIPARVWDLKGRTLRERLFLALVSSFEDTGRGCYASDGYCAEFLECTEQQVRKMRKALTDAGLLHLTGYGKTRVLQLGPEVPRGGIEPGTRGRPAKPAPGGAIKNESCARKRKKLRPEAQKVAPGGAQIIKRDNKEDNKENNTVVMPFECAEFLEMWSTWKQERKERGIRSYTARGEQAALHNLQTLSKQDSHAAVKIIQQSIANGWQGLFPLREQPKRSNFNLETVSSWANS